MEAVRDIALTTAEKDVASRDLILAEFARHDAPLFRRLELFVLTRFGSTEEVANALADSKSIDDVSLWHEYAELLTARFGDLDATQRRPILALISSGPDRELTESQGERGVTERQIETGCRHWRLQRYFLIVEDLDGDARAEYESLLAEFGKPDHPTFHSVTRSWTGPTSPFSAEELLSMGSEKVLETLRIWRPEGGSEEPSPEGLGRILEDTVEKDPASYAEIAIGFADLDPDYLRGLLGGLTKAAKAETPFAWESVLDLCEEILATGTGADGSEARSSWLRRTTASLLFEGLIEGDPEIPYTERDRVWRIIETLLDDPDPPPDRDEGHDPATVAINSVRGEAMHAAIRYAFWVERNLETKEEFKGIDSLPELAKAIDRRLDPAIEQSLAIRAVLGQWSVQFVRMDKQWAESLMPRIFPSDPKEAAFFSAAWNAYVVFNQAWISVFETLHASYELAVERSEEVDSDLFMAGNPREHLGEHLFYLRFSGSIDLDADGILDRFWTAAPAEIRKHVIRDAGWSLDHGDPQLSDDVQLRILETWEWIFDQTQEELASLSAFGAWFGAPQLEDSWLLTQGQRVLELNVPLEPEHVVYDALPRMAANHPREAVEILRLMIVTDPERWLVLGSVDEVEQTLAIALNSDDEIAGSDAVAVINLLGARGVTEFRDLIP